MRTPAIIAAFCLTVSAHATGDPTLDDLIAALGSGDLTTREQAGEKLAESDATLEQIERSLTSNTLTPEQRHRLDAVGFERFARGPHGALGVQFDQSVQDRIVVDSVLKDFPATGVLKPRDAIIDVDGVPILPRHDSYLVSPLRPLVISKKPGDRVSIRVLRGGEQVLLDVTLGDFNNLASPAGLNLAELHDAWGVRKRRLGAAGGEPPPIDSGLGADALPDSGMDLARLERSMRERAIRSVIPSVVAGGRARPVDAASLDNAGGGGTTFVFQAAAVPPIDYSKFDTPQLQMMRRSIFNNAVQTGQMVQMGVGGGVGGGGGGGNRDLQRRLWKEQAEYYNTQLTLVDRELAKRAKAKDAPIAPAPPK